MKFIRHRVNRLIELHDLEPGLGAEIDLRSEGNKLILTHDPFTRGDNFEAFLGIWRKEERGTLILNPKEDGIESRAMELLAEHEVEDFFLLDLTIPTTVKLTLKQGISKVAIRVSRYESVESALLFRGKAEWIWLDCFDGNPLAKESIEALRGAFKLCVVSPELHGLPKTAIRSFSKALPPDLDAVCTKFPEEWQSAIAAP